ncbi:cytochrome P450 3A8-like [Dermacentor andersoni]|uniref:cytochrome P450 3A8-like n=1 Tax=Dermacentor andersoni TaxID=34620 RepID=UPI002416DFB7|nr:probable cytochrome P450 6a23 [Dermacentor andersoni]
MFPLEVTLFAAVFLVATFTLWATRRRHKQGRLRRYGIPGPEPSLLFGNYIEFKKDRIKIMEQWAQKYGKVYGFYEGEVAKVVIGDVITAKEIFVKRAHTFSDRPPMVTDIECILNSLIGLKGDEWKTVRNLLNPSFTSVKMKLMLDIIHLCSDTLVEIIGDQASVDGQADVNLSKLCQGISMDVITKCSLGWQVRSLNNFNRDEKLPDWFASPGSPDRTREKRYIRTSRGLMNDSQESTIHESRSDCQKNPDDPVITTIKKILWNSGNLINDVCILVPSLGTIMSYIFPLLSYGRLFTRMHENLHQVLQARKSGKSAIADIVQLMVEAQKNASSTNRVQNGTLTSASGVLSLKTSFIKDTHIVSNCFVFLVAGYETTASTLAFALYELARHPEEQRRLHDELMSAFPDKDVLSYEDLQALKRLDAVIRECLRLYPPLVLVTSRVCPEDTPLASGHIIPKGSHVILPTWNVLHDPDLWADPYHFIPDRFSERLAGERLAASGVAFGFGPRECIGKRLALLELKAVLSKLVRKYKFSVCGQTQITMKVKVPLINVFPERDIVLRVQARCPQKV